MPSGHVVVSPMVGTFYNAPSPGSKPFVSVGDSVSEGDTVKAGETLLVLEAMKMEHQVHAPVDGEVRRILFAAGDQVKEGDLTYSASVAADYDALRDKITGIVVADLVIDEIGMVRDVLIKESPSDLLSDAAIEAIEQADREAGKEDDILELIARGKHNKGVALLMLYRFEEALAEAD